MRKAANGQRDMEIEADGEYKVVGIGTGHKRKMLKVDGEKAVG